MVAITLRTVILIAGWWLFVSAVIGVAIGKAIKWADELDAERRRRELEDELARRRRNRSR